MTDYQLNKVIKMFRMIVEKCDDLEEAKRRLAELDDDNKDEEKEKES